MPFYNLLSIFYRQSLLLLVLLTFPQQLGFIRCAVRTYYLLFS